MKKAGLFRIIAAGLILLGGAGIARAQDPLCDTALFTKMTQRANLLGQIETSVVQNLVYKPDSVLEYTCFNSFMDVSVNNMTYYMTPFYITNVIQAGVTNYLNSNFAHAYMGDRLAGSPAGGTYVCSVMAYVWKGAKCYNFSSLQPQDNLYSLHQFVTSPDIRALVGTCNQPAPGSFGDIPVFGDPVVTAIRQPGDVCGLPFPTGLIVRRPGGGVPVPYLEKACPNPACNYTPTGYNSGNCN